VIESSVREEQLQLDDHETDSFGDRDGDVDSPMSEDNDVNNLRCKDRYLRPGIDSSGFWREDLGRFKETVSGNELAH
jgi:hypothetical protein